MLFVLLKGLDPQHLWCTALPLTLLFAVDAHKFANTRWSSPQQAPNKPLQTKRFFVVLKQKRTPSGDATMLRIRHCGTALGASLCVQAHSLSYMTVAKSAGRRHKALQAECFLFINLYAEIACSKRYYTSTYNERRRNARSSGDEEGSAEHQIRVRSCGCALFFLHQRNEWHNEATPLNVREPSVALPVGLCRRQKGETREEGGHILDMFALGSLYKKSTPWGVLFVLLVGF